MAYMTTEEFDRVLAAFSYLLQQVIEDPPAYFDLYELCKLLDAVEAIRLSALESEAQVAAFAVQKLRDALYQWGAAVDR